MNNYTKIVPIEYAQAVTTNTQDPFYLTDYQAKAIVKGLKQYYKETRYQYYTEYEKFVLDFMDFITEIL